MSLNLPVNTRHIVAVELPSASPGTQRQLDFIHYGVPGQGRKAYLQAALHADEIPGLLVIHKLIHLLDKADARGEISGHVILAPIANPIGNGQFLLGELSGRYDQASGINFNRNHLDLLEDIAIRVADLLGGDADVNTQIIRDAAVQIIAEQSPLNETDALKKALLMNAIDADIALDLHCDWQSVMHIYTGTPIWPEASVLAAYLEAQVSLLAKISGGHPFDEALSGLWWALAERFPDKAINNACMAATIELRGKADVEEHQAERDALALYYYLQASGVISGRAPKPRALRNQATPLDGVEKIIAPIAAVVSYNKEPGDLVLPGDVVCTLFDIRQYDVDKARTELTASVEGIMYSRRLDRLSRPGQVLCRIAGKQSLPDQAGSLLVD
jgi:predicted deacylase